MRAFPPRPDLDALARRALAEDRAWSDVTSRAVVPAGLCARARIVAKSPGVVAGLAAAAAVFRAMDRDLRVRLRVADGARVRRGTAVAEVRGRARAVLAAERTALNFVQRLSGVATLTRRCVDAARGTRAVILHTRKTTPLLRDLERAAVAAGGGRLHRRDLSSAVLLKENHLAAAGAGGGDDVRRLVARARRRAPRGARVEVEVQDLRLLAAVLAGGADVVMFDNLTPAQMRRGVGVVRAFARGAGRRILTEASGGIAPERVAVVARTGVDRISLGALTHSAPALDFSLDIEYG